jgi:hypothetical protein
LAGPIAVYNRIEAPGLSLSVPVLGDVHCGSQVVLERDNCRRLVRYTSPVIPKTAVVLNTCAQKTRVHIRMEDWVAIGSKLGKGSLRTPNLPERFHWVIAEYCLATWKGGHLVAGKPEG